VGKSGYGMIAAVAEGSIAEREGLRPGDQVVSINGHLLRDVIDYRFYGAEEELELVVERDGRRMVLQVERDYDEDLGLEFAAPTFDGIHRCHSHCAFCFIAGMPRGMRASLYVRDDDYRYSFLFGNFCTLTNLAGADWQRLAEQRLSPLYVSVHATDPALRRRILGHPAAPDVVDQLRQLGQLGLQLHTQVVLLPGLNDGPALAQTVADLAALHPAVQSIAIVPVGLTRYHRCDLRPYRPDEAEPILDQVTAWQKAYRSQHGLNLVYASDEWYLLAGRQVPPADEYDGFPQLENGVGLTRVFLDEWEETRLSIQGSTRIKSAAQENMTANFKDSPNRPLKNSVARQNSEARLPKPQKLQESAAVSSPIIRAYRNSVNPQDSLSYSSTAEQSPYSIKAGKITLVCGTLIAPLLEQTAAELSQLTGLQVEVVPVVNEFFGPTVTVSGLLTGRDVAAAMEGRDLGDAVFLPRTMFDAAGEVTLDDMTPSEIGARLGTRVETARAMGELFGLCQSHIHPEHQRP
jgi:putative radical SAM enzyme (TIGR03279 family)